MNQLLFLNNLTGVFGVRVLQSGVDKNKVKYIMYFIHMLTNI